MSGRVLLGIAMAWMAGVAIVGLCWPRTERLPLIASLALGGALGPFAVGVAFLAGGTAGVPAARSVPVIGALTMMAAAWVAWRRWRLPLGRGPRTPLVVILVVASAIAWSTWVAGRTHLGWDGTVVWYHKARMLAASDGAMPSTALADPTRSWTAPDYPLHVPLAMAWVRTWQPDEDERALKWLPAAWCAAVWLLVAAAVLERTRSAAWTTAAVVVLATTPRLLVGEGSYTSGYADGPLAGGLAALLWIVWRSDDDEAGAWQPLLVTLAVLVACTKQEGLVAVAVAGAMSAWRAGRWSRGAFAVPAIAVALGWQAWAAWHGAPTGMAYEWPGLSGAVGRVGPIVGAYVGEGLDVGVWGGLWPGLAILLWAQRKSVAIAPLAILATTSFFGALAFVWSDWPSVSLHLNVTVPRLIAATAPSMMVVACGAGSSPKRT